MASRLAPERPAPSSVISENYFQRQNFFNLLSNIDHSNDKCLFGDEYEKQFCFYLAQYSEINYDDHVCLIAEEVCWKSIIQYQLFLRETTVFIDCNLKQEEIYKTLSKSKFDRIILLNCLHKINRSSSSSSIINLFCQRLTKNGRLIIISREPNLNTLPFPNVVLRKWYEPNMNSIEFIERIQRRKRTNIEITQNDETIRFSIDKLKWFSFIYHQMFYPLKILEKDRIIDGLRRLNETSFKYHQGLIEIYDRLLFIVFQKTDY